MEAESPRGFALATFLWSRAAIWLGAVFALLVFPPLRHDDPTRIRDLGFLTDVWARWDSVWFLRIAEHGYGERPGTAAFYPLYPTLVAGLGRVFGGHYVLAGIVVSLAATLGSFVLLHRLASDRLGLEGGRRAVLYLALFPMALFLQAVYSESLFLLLALGMFLLAERGRFGAAGVVAGLALLTRPTGFALLPALALLCWASRDRVRAFARAAPGLALFALYPLLLWRQTDDAFAFAHTERIWHRSVSAAGPLGGLWQALHAAWAGVLQLTIGSPTHTYWVAENAPRTAAINLECLAYLVLYGALTVVAWRRFGAAYGSFAALSILIPLSAPTKAYPLLSMPRFGLVVFPFFLALAALGASPRVHRIVVGVSGTLLGVAVVQWALWQWVS